MNPDVNLIENDTKSFQKPIEEVMQKGIKHFEGELIKIRTGRVHTSLIENIPVSCYNQPTMALRNFAALAAPEARLLTIQPWDLSIIPDIEKAILNSNLGVTPRNDGKIIRLQLPELSVTRREELVKVLGQKCEDCKVVIRSIRKDFNNLIRDAKRNKDISENFYNRLCDVLKKVTDLFTEKIELMAKKKKKEITTI